MNTDLQQWIDQLRDSDPAVSEKARERLIGRAMQRLEQLTRHMLRKSPRLQRWEQTDDVLQNALLRLYRSLASVDVRSVQQFYGLAATQIRRELIDLARHHFGVEGSAAHHLTAGGGKAADDPGGSLQQQSAPSTEPADLLEWSEFHQRVEQLPDEEREVFNLLWYDGMSQEEAAEVIGTTERVVKYRWRKAKLLLREQMQEPRHD